MRSLALTLCENQLLCCRVGCVLVVHRVRVGLTVCTPRPAHGVTQAFSSRRRRLRRRAQHSHACDGGKVGRVLALARTRACVHCVCARVCVCEAADALAAVAAEPVAAAAVPAAAVPAAAAADVPAAGEAKRAVELSALTAFSRFRVAVAEHGDSYVDLARAAEGLRVAKKSYDEARKHTDATDEAVLFAAGALEGAMARAHVRVEPVAAAVERILRRVARGAAGIDSAVVASRHRSRIADPFASEYAVVNAALSAAEDVAEVAHGDEARAAAVRAATQSATELLDRCLGGAEPRSPSREY